MSKGVTRQAFLAFDFQSTSIIDAEGERWIPTRRWDSGDLDLIDPHQNDRSVYWGEDGEIHDGDTDEIIEKLNPREIELVDMGE